MCQTQNVSTMGRGGKFFKTFQGYLKQVSASKNCYTKTPFKNFKQSSQGIIPVLSDSFLVLQTQSYIPNQITKKKNLFWIFLKFLWADWCPSKWRVRSHVTKETISLHYTSPQYVSKSFYSQEIVRFFYIKKIRDRLFNCRKRALCHFWFLNFNMLLHS